MTSLRSISVNGVDITSTVSMESTPEIVTWDFFQLSGDLTALDSGYENSGITLQGEGMLHLGNNELTVNGNCDFTAPDGKKFTSIVINAAQNNISGDGWSEGSWSGSDPCVSFSGNAIGISSIVFTLEDGDE
jgi:hypothetical protein